jgi:hypothetical protein
MTDEGALLKYYVHTRHTHTLSIAPALATPLHPYNILWERKCRLGIGGVHLLLPK